MTVLVVELHGERIGQIEGNSRSFDFQYDAQALDRYGPGSAVLSVGMLVAHPQKAAHRPRRQNFFNELIPEGRNREYIASQAGIEYGDVLGILTHYGRDIAGALQIWDPSLPFEPRNPSTEPVSGEQIAAMLTDMAAMPLGNVKGRGASSVAGVQAKLVLARVAGAWHRPLDGFPSTHIVKPASNEGATTIWDEEYGARAASALRLASHETWITDFTDTPALVVERYDRDSSAPAGRLHQEDFNQALGASGDQKYQKPGGKVTLARIARLVVANCGPADLEALARRTVLAVAMGDLDMHAKNLSLLHRTPDSVALAPAYDVVPQSHLTDSGEMALAVNGIYVHAHIGANDLVSELQSWGLRQASELVVESLTQIATFIDNEAPLAGAHPGLRDEIATFCENLLSGRKAGTSGLG